MAVSLSNNQVVELQNYLQNAQYTAGYNYLRDIVNQQIPGEGDPARSQDLYTLSAWFEAAAHINANDGSFVSEFVRGTTEGVMVYQGASVTDTQFQDASNKLAEKILSDAIQYGSIGTANEVVKEDIQNAVDVLQMPPWAWAGAITDFLPKGLGLGQDLASVPLGRMDVMAGASGRGLARAFDRLLSDGVISTVEEFRAIIEATGNSVGDFLFDFTHQTLSCLAVRPWTAKWVYIGTDDDLYSDPEERASERNEFKLTFIPPTDPLVLDLNGNGIDTVGANAGILFDHNASGIKQGTGWVAPSDGFLVMDKLLGDGAQLIFHAT